jgi:hypothetical protein
MEEKSFILPLFEHFGFIPHFHVEGNIRIFRPKRCIGPFIFFGLPKESLYREILPAEIEIWIAEKFWKKWKILSYF